MAGAVKIAGRAQLAPKALPICTSSYVGVEFEFEFEKEEDRFKTVLVPKYVKFKLGEKRRHIPICTSSYISQNLNLNSRKERPILIFTTVPMYVR